MKQVQKNTKEWDQMNRTEKKAIIILLSDKRKVKPFEWIDEISRHLPKMVDVETGKPIDYVKAMRSVFFKQGVDAVKLWYKEVIKIHNELIVELAHKQEASNENVSG